MAKYPWGDNPVDDRVFGVSLLWTGTLFTLFLRYIVPADGLPAIDSGMAFKETFSKKGEPLGGGVAGTVLATLAFVWVHWNGMGIQVFTRMMKQNMSEGASYCTGRIMGNLLEHSVVYLPLLWLHCAYVNSKEAQYLGLLYAGLRFLYHVIFGVFGGLTSWLKAAVDDNAPLASQDCPKAWVAPTHPRAQPMHLGSSPWPQQPGLRPPQR